MTFNISYNTFMKQNLYKMIKIMIKNDKGKTKNKGEQ